jgi:hypothetical protein
MAKDNDESAWLCAEPYSDSYNCHAGILVCTTEGHNFHTKPFSKVHDALSLVALICSAVCGLLCVVNRLWDSRGTAKRARGDSTSGIASKENLDGMGRTTWVLFYSHLVTFALGVALLAVTLLLTGGGKLR